MSWFHCVQDDSGELVPLCGVCVQDDSDELVPLCGVCVQDDSDELHCKVCKLYFSSLHNKKEHLLGRQHLQAITGKHTTLAGHHR